MTRDRAAMRFYFGFGKRCLNSCSRVVLLLARALSLPHLTRSGRKYVGGLSPTRTRIVFGEQSPDSPDSASTSHLQSSKYLSKTSPANLESSVSTLFRQTDTETPSTIPLGSSLMSKLASFHPKPKSGELNVEAIPLAARMASTSRTTSIFMFIPVNSLSRELSGSPRPRPPMYLGCSICSSSMRLRCSSANSSAVADVICLASAASCFACPASVSALFATSSDARDILIAASAESDALFAFSLAPSASACALRARFSALPEAVFAASASLWAVLADWAASSAFCLRFSDAVSSTIKVRVSKISSPAIPATTRIAPAECRTSFFKTHRSNEVERSSTALIASSAIFVSFGHSSITAPTMRINVDTADASSRNPELLQRSESGHRIAR